VDWARLWLGCKQQRVDSLLVVKDGVLKGTVRARDLYPYLLRNEIASVSEVLSLVPVASEAGYATFGGSGKLMDKNTNLVVVVDDPR